MAGNPIHMIATPIGVNFSTPMHDPTDDSQLFGSYESLTDNVAGATNVPAKDETHLTINDWVYANRLASSDI